MRCQPPAQYASVTVQTLPFGAVPRRFEEALAAARTLTDSLQLTTVPIYARRVGRQRRVKG